MRGIIFAAVAVLSWCAASLATAAPPGMPDIQGDPIEAAGNQSDLASRAATCVSLTLRFDPVSLDDAGSEAIWGSGHSKSEVIPGGDVLIHADNSAGIVVANSRAPFRMMSLDSVVQSKVTVETKDGRFRIRHSDILVAMKSTGYMANDGFSAVRPGVKAAKQAAEKLLEVSQKLGACIVGGAGSDW